MNDGPILVILNGVPLRANRTISTGDMSPAPFRGVENPAIDLPVTISTLGASAPAHDDEGAVIDLYPETDPETGAVVWR